MPKFVVVLYRMPDAPVEQFRSILRAEHAAMAERIPDLRRYILNHVALDPRRKHPGWDAIVEIYRDDWPSMEAAWTTPRHSPDTRPRRGILVSIPKRSLAASLRAGDPRC